MRQLDLEDCIEFKKLENAIRELVKCGNEVLDKIAIERGIKDVSSLQQAEESDQKTARPGEPGTPTYSEDDSQGLATSMVLSEDQLSTKERRG
jgi:hypothetical protein